MLRRALALLSALSVAAGCGVVGFAGVGRAAGFADRDLVRLADATSVRKVRAGASWVAYVVRPADGLPDDRADYVTHNSGSQLGRSDWNVAFKGGMTPVAVWVLPAWFAAAVLILPPLVPAAVARARRTARHCPSGERLCRMCGYDLRATPDRCPECGATTDVTNVGRQSPVIGLPDANECQSRRQ
ncbi:MAG TPA: hypothetical protein VF796_24290 [Humisphaera sp.]